MLRRAGRGAGAASRYVRPRIRWGPEFSRSVPWAADPNRYTSRAPAAGFGRAVNVLAALATVPGVLSLARYWACFTHRAPAVAFVNQSVNRQPDFGRFPWPQRAIHLPAAFQAQEGPIWMVNCRLTDSFLIEELSFLFFSEWHCVILMMPLNLKKSFPR